MLKAYALWSTCLHELQYTARSNEAPRKGTHKYVIFLISWWRVHYFDLLIGLYLPRKLRMCCFSGEQRQEKQCNSLFFKFDVWIASIVNQHPTGLQDCSLQHRKGIIYSYYWKVNETYVWVDLLSFDRWAHNMVQDRWNKDKS